MKGLADQLVALGLGKSKPSNKKTKPVTDFRAPSTVPSGTADIEAAMAKKLAQSSCEPPADSSPRPSRSELRKQNAAKVDVERRKRPSIRTAADDRAANQQDRSIRRLTGELTQAARDRLRYEPASLPEEPHHVSEADSLRKVESSCDGELPRKCEVTERRLEDGFSSYAEAFHHITALVGATAPQIEERPSSLAAEEVSILERRIERGSQWLRSHSQPDELNGYVVGFDFGTSSLKIVVREPYAAGNDVAALPAPPELQSFKHPYLWQTAVWFDPTEGTFLLYPVPGAKVLEGFKTGIIGGRGSDAIWGDPEVSRSEAATAFIALHLRHLMGWYEEEKPLKRSLASNFLSINIGVPVATQDNPAALQPFREVVRAAVELASSCEPITLDRVKAAVEMVCEEDVPRGYALIPELSAALVGYGTDPTSPLGAHVLIDVGASTMDVVAFNLLDNAGQPEIKAFAASVELLGAAALDVARAEKVRDADFLAACNYQFGDTYGLACDDGVAPRSFSRAKNPQREDVRLIITGGGCDTSVHSQMIGALPGRLLGAQTPARPEPPKNIAAIECERSRLLLAYGLAHDHPDIPHPTLPSGIPPIDPQYHPEGPGMIGPEQM